MKAKYGLKLLAGCAMLSIATAFAAMPAAAGGIAAVDQAVNPNEQGDGTMNAAARHAMTKGHLSASAADVALKEAADRAAGATGGASGDVVGTGNSRLLIASSFQGLSAQGSSPPDTTGATGAFRVIETVNSRASIYSRTSSLPISTMTLNQLGGLSSSVNTFDPQIIWDPTTGRFYYAMDAVFSSTDNRIAYGFSKTSSPNSAADFCHYATAFGSTFPDFPKLGDSASYIMYGVNNYAPSFIRSDVNVRRKPPSGSTCPGSISGFNFQNLKDSGGSAVFSPTPANGVDSLQFGYVVARNLFLPSTKLWIFAFSGTTATVPTLTRRVVTVSSYTVPPGAQQPNFATGAAPKLDTSDTRMTQAVVGLNPSRQNIVSMWTQQTVPASNGGSNVRVYEIRPDVSSPVLLRQRTLVSASSNIWLFNAAVSSDRRAGNGATGNNAVVTFSRSSASISPQIMVGSAIGANTGFTSFAVVKSGAGPYRDFTCPSSSNTCRWGDYAGANPDPLPTGGATSAVGIFNQYSKGGSMSTASANWTTWIAHVRP